MIVTLTDYEVITLVPLIHFICGFKHKRHQGFKKLAANTETSRAKSSETEN